MPTIAFAMPVGAWPKPNGTGVFVKKSRFDAPAPRRATEQTTTTRMRDREEAASGDRLHRVVDELPSPQVPSA